MMLNIRNKVQLNVDDREYIVHVTYKGCHAKLNISARD